MCFAENSSLNKMNCDNVIFYLFIHAMETPSSMLYARTLIIIKSLILGLHNTVFLF